MQTFLALTSIRLFQDFCGTKNSGMTETLRSPVAVEQSALARNLLLGAMHVEDREPVLRKPSLIALLRVTVASVIHWKLRISSNLRLNLNR